MKRWFFSAGLMIDYYGSVNSYADRDCNRLERWASPSGREPESVAALTRAYVEGLDLSQPFTREGNILGRTIMSILVATGALDWTAGQLRVSNYDSIDFHHMVPEQRLKAWYPRSSEERRPISVMTPLTSAINRAIGNQNAADVIRTLANDAGPTMTSHALDMTLLETAWNTQQDFETFRRDREQRLKDAIIRALGL